MLKEIVLIVGLFFIVKGLIMQFARPLIIPLAEKMVKEIKTKKRYKMANLFALLDVIIGLALIYIASSY